MARNNLNEALAYLKHGISVVPCHTPVDGGCSCGRSGCTSIGKHPRIPSWTEFQKRLPTTKEVTDWWTKWPDANIGSITGKPSNYIILDIDGAAGYQALAEAGLPFEELPSTPMVDTGKGVHLYLAYDEDAVKALDLKTRAGVLPQVDIRADGGLVIMPPSLHASGRRYEWREGSEIGELPFAEFDQWDVLLKAAKKEAKSKTGSTWSSDDKWAERLLNGVTEGSRNEQMTRLAGLCYRRGMSPLEVDFYLKAVNEKNNPPLPDKEIETIVASIRDSHHKKVQSKLLDEDGNRRSEDELEEQARRDVAMAWGTNLHLETVRKISGEPMQYVLEFEEGVVLLSSKDFWSPKPLKDAISETTGVVVPLINSKSIPKSDVLYQALLNLAVDVDAGEEATLFGELKVMLKEYLQAAHVVAHDKEGIPDRGPFYRKEVVWISLLEFTRWVGQVFGKNPGVSSVAQRLGAWGCPHRTFTSEAKQRQMYGVPIDLLGRELEQAFDSGEDLVCEVVA